MTSGIITAVPLTVMVTVVLPWPVPSWAMKVITYVPELTDTHRPVEDARAVAVIHEGCAVGQAVGRQGRRLVLGSLAVTSKLTT